MHYGAALRDPTPDRADIEMIDDDGDEDGENHDDGNDGDDFEDEDDDDHEDRVSEPTGVPNPALGTAPLDSASLHHHHRQHHHRLHPYHHHHRPGPHWL